MPYVDILIVIVVGVFAAKGFFKGFFNEALTLVGFIVAFFFATNVYGGLGGFVAGLLGISAGLAKFVAFLAVFLAIVFASAALGSVLSQGAKVLALSGMNRFLGSLFGAAKGFIAVGVIAAVMMEGAISPGLAAVVNSSFLAPIAIDVFDQVMSVINI
ncbi:CvpA family protein [bacterium]|nr:CvpA family protein [bacterium]